MTSPKSAPSGLPAALGAYLLWGFLPVYLIFVRSVPAFEFVGWRIIWTVPLCMLIVLARRQWPEVRAALREPRTMAMLGLSAFLIGLNWLVYIWAIQQNFVYAASLGYYINPLLNVMLGTVFLGERLNARQWTAVALAAAGIAFLLGGALTTLWISLTLAVSFASYGLVRKKVAVGALPGLTIESAILFLPATAIALYYAGLPQGSAFGVTLRMDLLILLGGVLTAVPLLLFAIAARRMAYSTLGFIQFLAPSIVFVLGLTVFGEPLKPAQLWCFILIWAALAVFVFDMWAKSRAAAPATLAR